MVGGVIDFGHVGLQVRDLDRSLAYYRDVLGLRVVERGVRSDRYLADITGYPGVELDIAVLETPTGVLVELLEYTNVVGEPVDTATRNPGTGHVCFQVEDVDAIYHSALDAGHGAVSPPVTPTSGRWTGGRSVYLIDPDGIRVELVQRGPSPDSLGG